LNPIVIPLSRKDYSQAFNIQGFKVMKLQAFFVVITDEVEIVRSFGAYETLVTVHGYSEFTEDVNMLSGRLSFFRARVTKDSNSNIILYHSNIAHCRLIIIQRLQ
jgi:hypothetical protein